METLELIVYVLFGTPCHVGTFLIVTFKLYLYYIALTYTLTVQLDFMLDLSCTYFA